METYIKVLGKPKFKKPILIEGLPGIGNVGRVTAGYLISELKMKKFAELYSPHFLPLVLVHPDSTIGMLRCEFYYSKNIIILTGDTQSISPEGHYEICDKILEFAEKLGVKDIITMGGFAEGKDVSEPRVIGAVNDAKLLKKFSKYPIDFSKDHPVGTILGASGLLLGLSKLRDMDGLCLMGETSGLPLMTDPKAADRLLKVVIQILEVKMDLGKLEKTVKEMEDKMKKTDKIHQKMLQDYPKHDDIKYIG